MKIGHVASLIILAIWPSAAQAQQPTRDQCRIIAEAMQPMISSVTRVDYTLSSVDWAKVSGITSGEFRVSSEAARATQANLVEAVKKYLIALQDVTYRAQVCAR